MTSRALLVFGPVALIAACGGRLAGSGDAGGDIDAGGVTVTVPPETDARTGVLLDATTVRFPDATVVGAPDANTGAPDVGTIGAVDAFIDTGVSQFDAALLTTCVDCLSFACADLFVQCQQAGQCASLYQCALVANQNDPTCLCNAPSNAVGPYLALERCMHDNACSAGSCTTLCQLGNEGTGVGPISCARGAPFEPGCDSVISRSSTTTCTTCASKTCAAFTSQCDPASDCQVYIACVAHCQDSECSDDCGAANPAGQTAAEALDVCVGSSCQAECGY